MKQAKLFFIATLGCRLNQAEAEEIAASLEAYGWERMRSPERALMMIVNTCVVTKKAEHETRKMIRGLRRKNRQGFLVVCGCWVNKVKSAKLKVQSYSSKFKVKDVNRGIEEIVDLVVMNEEKEDLIKILGKKMRKWQKHGGQRGKEAREYINYSSGYQRAGRGLVWVQKGCVNGCSYCIVPYTRSRLMSRSTKEVVQRIKEMHRIGIKEVVLTGVNLSSWREANLKLSDLVKKILVKTAIARIRFGSVDFDCFDDDFIALFKNPRVCRHVHLPIQSGSDKTLKKMKRLYKVKEVSKLVRELRGIKGMSVTTDVMVGFPGETEEDSEESLENIEKIGFDKVHVFAFSKRPGTLAAKMIGKPGWKEVSKQEKKARSVKMRKLGKKMRMDFLDSQVRRILPVLFGEKKRGTYWGLSDNYLPVEVVSEQNLQGRVRKVKITKRQGLTLRGEL